MYIGIAIAYWHPIDIEHPATHSALVATDSAVLDTLKSSSSRLISCQPATIQSRRRANP